jgi:hypothetical protein
MDDDLKNHLNYQTSQKFHVEEILDDRYVEETKQVLVKWLGFDEPTWEPEQVIQEDVPKILESYYHSKQ